MRSDDDDRCSISTSTETRCHTDESGAWKCEELRRKFRHCPGRATEEISVERAETDAPPPRAPFAFGGWLLGRAVVLSDEMVDVDIDMVD